MVDPADLPPLPWGVMWVNNGYCYLTAADGRKIATIYGRQAQREAIAEAMLMAFGRKPDYAKEEKADADP